MVPSAPDRRRGPAGRPRLVAAAAIVLDGAVLAARRTAPPPVAGRWELPGGKVEPGESPEQAAVREVAEELGVAVRVGRRIGRRHPIRPGLALVVVLAELAGEAPTSSIVHDELRWLRADDLDEVDWLPADRPVLPLLRALLTAAAAPAGRSPVAGTPVTTPVAASSETEPTAVRTAVGDVAEPRPATGDAPGSRHRRRRRRRGARRPGPISGVEPPGEQSVTGGDGDTTGPCRE